MRELAKIKVPYNYPRFPYTVVPYKRVIIL